MEPAYTPPHSAKCILLRNSRFPYLSPFLSRSVSLVLIPLFLPSLFLPFSLPLYSLSPSTGPGIPSCECKIDGASRDNCCSGTRFQTRVHLEYTWRKALPMVDGRSKGRARSDFSFVKRFFGHDTVCYRSPIQPRVFADTPSPLGNLADMFLAEMFLLPDYRWVLVYLKYICIGFQTWRKIILILLTNYVFSMVRESGILNSNWPPIANSSINTI